jgi:hypothetical protein
VRAVTTGLLLAVLFAIVAPVNDQLLHNTYLYSQHLPVGVFFVLVLFGVVVNPLLGPFRFRANELLVVFSMLLVLGGVVAAGLNGYLPPIIAGPAKVIATSSELDAFVDRHTGEVQLPKGPYIGLERGAPDVDDPEYQQVIDGYHGGYGGLGMEGRPVGHRSRVTWLGPDGVACTRIAWSGGDGGPGVLDLDRGDGRAMAGHSAGEVVQGPSGRLTIRSVASPGIPWSVWAAALWAWTPTLGSALICFICIAALVRRQWMDHERLTYPIAEVISAFLQDPEPGRRLGPVFRRRAFWIAFAVVAVVLGSQGLAKMGLLPLSIPTRLDLFASFDFAPFNQGYAPASTMLSPTIYFSIVGLVFFLPSDVSLSVWLCLILGNAVCAGLRSQGVPIDLAMAQKTSMGGWFAECVFILWIGRRSYLALLRTAFTRTDDPQLVAMRPFTWAFLASAAGLVLSMVALGALWHHAVIAALCYLGAGLVLARLVAEAGIPFIQMPMFAATVIFSFTGLSAPMGALVPLTMLGQSLNADCREHLLPFACNAEYLAGKAGVPRVHWGVLALVVLAIGTLISGAMMLWCAYGHAGQKALDGWWRPGPLMGSLGPIASAAEGGTPIDLGTTWTCYGIGAAITGALASARLAWSWWPVSPIGMLVCACYPLYKIWFSFLIGWLLKTLVLRYGAVRLYNAMKPAALGLIASEAVIAGLFLLIGLIAGPLGVRLPKILFLPE